MLDTLRRIVQEVSSSVDLGQALAVIVARVKQALDVDVCSVYLVAPGKDELVLMATEGLNPESRGQVRLRFSEGLVGFVAERAEAVNLENAAEHPRFKYFPQTGEERYRAFMGAPIIHHRQLLGVMVVQTRQQRRFDDDHAAFLITLAAQLAGAISHAEISGEIDALRLGPGHEDVLVRGMLGAPGVAVGQAIVAYPHAELEAVPERVIEDTEREVRRFHESVQQVQEEMVTLKERLGAWLPAEDRALFDAYVMMLGSDNLVHGTVERIKQGNWAPGALRETIREAARAFDEMDDSYLRERADDIHDLGRRLLAHLLAGEDARAQGCPERAVLVGANVSVAELADVPPERLVGVVSGAGSSSSHVAILCRAMGVPAVMATTDLPLRRLEGREMVVDGYTARVLIQPSAQARAEFERLAREEQELAAGLSEIAARPAVTPDGLMVPIYVNSGLLADTAIVSQASADGIGLYRTEFPFMVRERFPGEEEQFRIYREVLNAMAPRPVTLRTLDVGGDKALPYFPVKEDNPFLGWRGIRIMLDHPELFLTQLRAMLRAAEGLDNMQLLLPMVSSLGEVTEALGLLQRARGELLDEGVAVVMPKVGVMVEVPSAVYIAEALARQVDFLSVGSNDLVQYLLAVDRNNARVADLYQAMHPSVLRALHSVVAGARAADKPVGVCGEMASDPASVVVLLGMGIDNLSVSLGALAKVKWVVSSFTRERARALFEQALEMDDPSAIRSVLHDALVSAGLGGLLRPGKH